MKPVEYLEASALRLIAVLAEHGITNIESLVILEIARQIVYKGQVMQAIDLHRPASLPKVETRDVPPFRLDP